MKNPKLLCFLTIIMCFMLAGCNTGDKQLDNNKNNQNSNYQNNESNTSNAQKILLDYGLTIEMIKPDNENSKPKASSSETSSEIVFIISNTSFSENEYYEKVYNAIKSISDDNKIYISDTNFMLGKDKTEGTFDDVTTSTILSNYGYVYKNKNIVVNVSSPTDYDDNGNQSKMVMIVFFN